MRLSLIGLLLCGLAALGFAQAQEATYRLQPEDIIRIQIYNEAQVNTTLPIGKDGNISAPFVGIIRAQGKTTTDLEEELRIEYIKRLKLVDPKVSVTIERFRAVRVAVTGLVGRPNVFEVRYTDTLLTVLSLAGGVASDRGADLKRATLRHADSPELIPIDLQAMLIYNDTSQNYVVRDGDELNVPEQTRDRILVLGAVIQPGTVGYRDNMRLIDALSLARGPVPTRSKLSETMVIREKPGEPGSYLRIKANLVNFLNKGDSSQNILLQPGDVINVPETKTPSLDQIGSLANTLFIFNRYLGFRFLGF